MRPLLRPLCGPCASLRSCPTNPPLPRIQQRTFFPGLPLSTTTTPTSTQSITATRTLPYPPTPLYNIISDIDAYSTFLPYVLSSKVLTRHPVTHSPTTADLRIGFSPIDETFRSKVTCEEPSLVEADASGNSVFEILKTRWEIHPAAGDATSSIVDLKIEVGFVNPLYRALTQAVVPKMAGVMIDAFERRAKEMLEKDEEWVKKLRS